MTSLELMLSELDVRFTPGGVTSLAAAAGSTSLVGEVRGEGLLCVESSMSDFSDCAGESG